MINKSVLIVFIAAKSALKGVQISYLTIVLLFAVLMACDTKEAATNDTFIVNGALGLKVDSILTPYVNQLLNVTDNTAAMAIGIVKTDTIIYAKTFGMANVASGQMADLNTAFHIASVSKPFSAIAVAKLIQENKIALDDFVIDYIPEFRMKGVGYDSITIEHILTHTSGIPRNIAVDDWLHPSFGPKAMEENLAIVNELELDFKPGSKFSYSNSAFDILGIVISRASGMPFDQYIKNEILTPIGMTNSGFKKPKDFALSNWAMSHSYGLETQELTPFPYNERLFPSSGVVASLKDMCLWGQFHLGKGTINDAQILDPQYYNLVVSPKFDTPWNDSIGLSWFLQSYLDRPIIMHTGADTGFESLMYVYPEEDISIIVMANRDFSRTARIINATSEVVFNELPKSYEVSAKYPFAATFRKDGIEKAIEHWSALKKDTLDIYFTDDDDLLTTGAILENGKKWQETKEVLNYFVTINNKSTYAWRLLGNANLNLGDTLVAIECYKKTLEINPNYDKGKLALEQLGIEH